MYDYPLPSSSSYSSAMNPPSPSPMKRNHPSRRSHSPVPRIATLLPYSNHSQYSPNSRAADISRLLDPAYSSSSSSSSAGSSSRAYVDHRGDLHDPDYRDFPVLRPASRTKTTRKQRRTSGSSIRSLGATHGERYSTYSLTATTPRPNWEREWTADLENDEVIDDEDDDGTTEGSHFSPFSSSSTRTPQQPRRATYATHHSHYYGDHIPISSSPVSFHSDNALQLNVSPFDESELAEVEVEEKERTQTRRNCLVRRGSRGSNTSEKKNASGSKVEQDRARVGRDDSVPLSTDVEFVPSCTDTLRRQWQAMSLRVRFGVFHAKQRLRRSLK